MWAVSKSIAHRKVEGSTQGFYKAANSRNNQNARWCWMLPDPNLQTSLHALFPLSPKTTYLYPFHKEENKYPGGDQLPPALARSTEHQHFKNEDTCKK